MIKPLWTAQDVAAVTSGTLIGSDFPITGISIDTRNVARGDLFIALKGPRHDGNDFALRALESGAAGVLVDKGETAKHIIVQDTFRALQDLGSGGRSRSHAKIFAITGSVGKTSTKELLAHVLSGLGTTHAAEASLNNHWGVPLTLARLPQEAEYAVVEIGMNHANEISPLSKMTAPHVAIITTIAAVHIQNLGSLENIALAKSEIFHGMDADGIAVLPRDCDQFPILLAEARTQGLQKIVTFGEHAEADVRLISLNEEADQSVVTVKLGNDTLSFPFPVPGKHQVLNAVAVLAALWASNEDVKTAMPGLSQAKIVKGRGNRFIVTVERGKAPLLVIDETHNASPIAVEAALKVIERIQTDGRRILILGDMLELGPNSPKFHADLKNPILAAHIDQVFTCGPLMAHLAATLPPGMNKHYPDSQALADDVATLVCSGDVIAVKGSRGSKMPLIIDALKRLGQFEELDNAVKTAALSGRQD